MMDRTDYEILNQLQQDSRLTLRMIGERVNLTPPAVSERIHKMEMDGIIRGFSIKIDRTLLDCSITGFILVASRPEKYSLFCKFCEDCPQIIEHHHVIGDYNAFLRFAVHDTNQLEALLAQIKVYGDSRTSVELKTQFDHKDLTIPAR